MARPRNNSNSPATGKLSDAQKVEIVTRLAVYDSPTAVRNDLHDQGVDISLQAIRKYDPYTPGSTVAKKWKDLFDTTREGFLKELAKEPIANRAVRLRKLNGLFEAAVATGEIDDARKVLEQAAKEVGNVYSNVQKLSGSVGFTATPTSAKHSPEEAANMLADRLSEAFAKHPAAQKAARPTKH